MKSALMALAAAVVITVAVTAQGKEETKAVSFKEDVFPILKRHCLPCHAEDNENPSELSLDSYELLKAGGKHGAAFTPGKSAESPLIRKFSTKPPFGDRMPLNSRKRVAQGKAKWLMDEEVKTIATWIDQGAKDN